MTDGKHHADISGVEAALSVSFHDRKLLLEALTHRSSLVKDTDPGIQSNERLEFLGDAVLQLCISDILMRQYPGESEGELTKLRASLVNEATLAAIASRRRLGRFLHLGKGEDAAGGRKKRSILADAFEAVAGAVYLDQGYEEARTWITRMFSPSLKAHIARSLHRDYKTVLQEFSQKAFGQLPRYELLETSGPDHDKIFRVRVTVGNTLQRRGSGKSRKAAEMSAAQRALKALEKRTVLPVTQER